MENQTKIQEKSQRTAPVPGMQPPIPGAQTQVSQMQPQTPEMQPQSSSKFSIKWLVLGIFAILALGGIVIGAYYFKIKKDALKPEPLMEKKVDVVEEEEPLSALDTSELEFIVDDKDEGIVPLGENTVAFTRLGDAVQLRYRGKIYDDSDPFTMEPVSGFIDQNLTWFGLVDAPDFVSPGVLMFDEVFGLLSYPDNKSFVFIMRWGNIAEGSNPTAFYVYYYNPANTPKVKPVHKFVPTIPSGNEYKVPINDQFSDEGKYLALDMFSCWNCGGHHPQKLLVNLTNNQMKNIGKVSYFEWRNNGAYEYKDYVVIPCDPPEQMGECSVGPAHLPLKTGNL